MRYVTRVVGPFVVVLLLGCAPCSVMATPQTAAMAEFLGSTPADALPREFLGGLSTNVPCHYIAWHITFSTRQTTGSPATCKLVARYHVPAPNNPNQSVEGPRVALQGTWEILTGSSAQPDAVVYRIKAEEPERFLSLIKVSENLLHVLNADGTLMVGNGGASYTLNRAGHSEELVDKALATAAPDMSYKISPLATGPAVFGVFEGRSPCHGMAKELKSPQHEGCMKVKWRVTLYQNPETAAPTNYKIEGTLYRQGAREGTWNVTRGSKPDPEAIVYELSPTPSQSALLLLKGDENVLFFLDQRREPMVGHAEFSYTLNRVLRK